MSEKGDIEHNGGGSIKVADVDYERNQQLAALPDPDFDKTEEEKKAIVCTGLGRTPSSPARLANQTVGSQVDVEGRPVARALAFSAVSIDRNCSPS